MTLRKIDYFSLHEGRTGRCIASDITLFLIIIQDVLISAWPHRNVNLRCNLSVLKYFAAVREEVKML